MKQSIIRYLSLLVLMWRLGSIIFITVGVVGVHTEKTSKAINNEGRWEKEEDLIKCFTRRYGCVRRSRFFHIRFFLACANSLPEMPNRFGKVASFSSSVAAERSHLDGLRQDWIVFTGYAQYRVGVIPFLSDVRILGGQTKKRFGFQG